MVSTSQVFSVISTSVSLSKRLPAVSNCSSTGSSMSESESMVRGVSRMGLKQRQVTWLLRTLVMARMPLKGTPCDVKISE